ncbi:acyl-CoA--sterol O-acyltransferase 1-like [Quillaja saponaria]|uniref:Acyl-CoA--sterol O-acyltransferase 1-like n=1 Tax=Quillaja saponaria TaxID=32244 RepID=A0AAD7M323_QUISA|nr:acyl-CoA--sterol O-acyltransferase 1-like [Quillaja saponaria]
MKIEDVSKNPMMNPTVVLIVSLGYCYSLVTKIPKGGLRVISLLPIFYFFSILPWYFSSAILRGLSSFFVTWITSFKLLLFSFDRGPLLITNKRDSNFIDFIVIALFPFKIKGNLPDPNSSGPSMGSKSVPRVLFVVIFPILLYLYKKEENYPPNILLILHSVSFISGFYLVWKYGGNLVQATGRYELVPLFNQPYLATSL